MAERRTSSAHQSPARKRPAKKTTARKASARKTSAKKTTARKAASHKATARKLTSATPTSRNTNARKASRSGTRAGKAAKASARKAPAAKRWSQHVTETSDALDLKGGVFKLRDPRKIAASLKRSAEHSDRKKTGSYRSALSMLTFYINRAGKNLPKTQLTRLERAKGELKKQFGRA